MAESLSSQEVKAKVAKVLADAEGNLRWLQENVPRLFAGVLREDEEVVTALAVGLSRLRTERHLVLADREKELVVAQLDVPGSIVAALQRLEDRAIYQVDAVEVSAAA